MPFDPKHCSRTITEGRSRAGARAMLKAIGFTDADLAKPIVGIANTWIETMPCNYHLRELAVKVKEGVRAAGGTPMEFNTIAISDGVTMGTEGMKASLVSREVIADSIELLGRGHMFDAMVALVGCDKTIPGGAMALIRLNVPSILLYGGSIAAGRFQGHDVTVGDVYEAIGAHAAGKMTDAELKDLEDHACPGAGSCGGQFTANTMSTVMEFIGLSPMGANGVPAVFPSQGRIRLPHRRDGNGPAPARRPPARHPYSPGLRERHCQCGGHRRLHQRRPAPAGHGARGGRSAHYRRL